MPLDLFSRFSKTGIRLISVDLGTRKVRIPVADIIGLRPGKTLLMTAGVDGDEYAGMEAAYQLIEQFSSRDFCGRLIVLPIVNIPGYEAECSLNPLDGQYPKFVFPGNANGRSTQRLIHWLVSTYAAHADVWHDLHGGALTERVQPFFWTFETGLESADRLTRMFHESVPAELVVFEKTSASSKATTLAHRGCTYVLTESGDRIHREEDAERHVEWTKKIMESMEMVPKTVPRKQKTRTLMRQVTCLTAPYNGWWSPGTMQHHLKKNEPIGMHMKIDRSSPVTLRALSDGIVLWQKETASMRKGDVLCAIGR